jgi:hypothetical protein
MGGSSETKFLQELVLYAASAALSCLVLFAGLRHLDPNREATKKAIEQKKEIAKRLGRPLIQTNPYEVRNSFQQNATVSRAVCSSGSIFLLGFGIPNLESCADFFFFGGGGGGGGGCFSFGY